MVKAGDQLLIEKIDQAVGEEVVFDQILMVSNGSAETVKFGQPLVAGATVSAKVLEQGRAEKKIVFKFTHKTRYKKKKGHRQPFTKVAITKILGGN